MTLFTGYNLTEMRALTLKRLRCTDTTRYSPTQGTADYDWIDDALNRAQEEFVKKTLCLRTYAVVEIKANYGTYRLPWNFLDFMTAYYYDSTLTNGYRELTVTTVENLNDDVEGWRTATGSPTHIFIDRIYGKTWMFGLYPIPENDGDTITFDTDYGSEVTWVCPIYVYSSEYGVIIRATEDGTEFYLNTDAGVVGTVTAMNRNVRFEYYRLPEKIDNITQIPEIPREYHLSLIDSAASELLADNPEDSVEFKRSIVLKKSFDEQVNTYIKKRKRPTSSINLQAKPYVWGWVKNMTFRKEMF